MRRLGLVFCAAACLSISAARAGSSTSSLQVTATVTSACVVSGSTLNFGVGIDPLGGATPIDATAVLSVQCTNTTPYTVTLDAGAHAGGASQFLQRSMRSGGNSLAYQLYLDAARTTLWGDGTGSTATSAGIGSGSSQSLTVYGRISSLGASVPGTYTDTVTITITY